MSLFEAHVNTVAVALTALAAPMYAAEGGRFRYLSLYTGVAICVTMSISADMQNNFREYRRSCILGAAGGAMLAIGPRLNLLRVTKFVPNTVTTSAGLFYIGYHGMQYAKARAIENNGDPSVNW